MITLNGKHNYAHIMIDTIDDTTKEQIQSFLDCPIFKGQQIRIMADCHAGKGSVVGFTSTFDLKDGCIIPNIVGVDIGCGVTAFLLEGIKFIDFESLDRYIKATIPSGKHIHQEELEFLKENQYYLRYQLEYIIQKLELNYSKVIRSLATLGGGNHFLEIDQDSKGQFWLLVHSGSRNFGLQVANYHQSKAKKLMDRFFMDYGDLSFLPMEFGGKEYLDDMKIASWYASFNRSMIADLILKGFFNLNLLETFSIESVHNYIDMDGKEGIIRKGAISAKKDVNVVIPLNMRDGVIIGKGKGSKKWNFSAPHGAGRLYSRNRAKDELSMDEFKQSMEGIYTSCISNDTLDESPMAYKDTNDILNVLSETVDVMEIMKPVYNFKAKE